MGYSAKSKLVAHTASTSPAGPFNSIGNTGPPRLSKPSILTSKIDIKRVGQSHRSTHTSLGGHGGFATVYRRHGVDGVLVGRLHGRGDVTPERRATTRIRESYLHMLLLSYVLVSPGFQTSLAASATVSHFLHSESVVLSFAATLHTRSSIRQTNKHHTSHSNN